MIWHFAEVWLMVVLTFVVGCLAGAHLYGFLAGTRLAPAQGAVADFIGDILDRIKVRIGMAPTWRRAHLRQVERPLPPSVPLPSSVPAQSESPGESEAAAPEMVPVSIESPPVVSPHAPSPAGNRSRKPRTVARTPAASAQPALPPPAAPPALRGPAIVPKRPPGLSTPRGGVPDNLQRIKGIGKRNERQLNEIGIYHFGQIAAWTPAEIEWIGEYLAFPERIVRDDWTGQATLLALGAGTGFQKSAERRRERRRQQREFQERMATASAAYHHETPGAIDDLADDRHVTGHDADGEILEADFDPDPDGEPGDTDDVVYPEDDPEFEDDRR